MSKLDADGDGQISKEERLGFIFITHSEALWK